MMYLYVVHKKFPMRHITLFLAAVIIFSNNSGSFAQIKKQSEPYPDDPAAREEYDYLRLRDPETNEIPSGIAQKEFEFATKLPKHNPFGAMINAPVAFDWQPIGPANQSGRIQAIGIDILNESNMLAGAASGGVWRSIDTGQSWVKVTLPNDEQSVSAIVQDTRKGKENTWYYSTGELLSTTGRRETSNIRTHSWGNGIYKSTDNGASWNSLSATVTTSKHSAAVNFTGIWNLALDPNNLEQDVIYAACYGGIMRSSDAGATWTNVLGGDSVKCFNSEIVRGSGGTLYAAIGSAYDGTTTPHQGVWRSTDGLKWANISGSILPKLIRRSRLALSESNDNVLYYLTETPNDWKFADTEFVTQNSLSKYSFFSGDGSGSGGKWESRTVPFDNDPLNHYKSLGGYALVLAVSPNDINTVFVGGTNLYYSTDGFQVPSSFIQIGGYPYTMQPGTLHPDMHALLFSRSNHSTLFVANDGGLDKLDDFIVNDNTWISFNNGLSSAQVYHSSLDHGTPNDNFIISGLQDNSTYATQSPLFGDPWFVVSGGDGMTTAVTNGGAQLFGSSQGGNIECFYNDGQSISYIGRLPPTSDLSISTFFTNYILEPNIGNELYEAETDHLWRFDKISSLPTQSGNLLPNWTELTNVANALHPLQCFITTFGFATDTKDRLFFGTSVGKVFEVDNASGKTPELKDISGADFPKNGFVAGIEVDPGNANEIIVVFSNYNIQSLFHTTDAGKAWNAIGANLEELPDGAGSGPSVRCAKILHTTNGTIYYVGTSVGLYSTTKINGLQTIWVQEAPTTIGNLIVESIDARQSDGRVIVSTQGGGVFRNIPTNAVKDNKTSQQFFELEQNFPNPLSADSKIRFTVAKRCEVTIDMYNALGEKISEVVQAFFDPGSHSIDLSAQNLPAANYFLRAKAGDVASTKMITIIK